MYGSPELKQKTIKHYGELIMSRKSVQLMQQKNSSNAKKSDGRYSEKFFEELSWADLKQTYKAEVGGSLRGKSRENLIEELVR